MARKPGITLAMIVKNEENYLGAALASVEDCVDEIVIVDTGSTDRTMEIAEEYGAKVYSYEWDNHFANARNFCFSKCKTEWIMWLDADDEVVEADRIPVLIGQTPKHIDAIYLEYLYDVDEDGNVRTTHWVARIVRNNRSFVWKGRLHETLVEMRRAGKVMNKEIKIKHRATEERRDNNLKRNISMLEAMLEEEKSNPDPRTMFYLGTAYIDAGRVHEAKELLLLYLNLSGWAEERTRAWCALGRIYDTLDEPEKAKDAFMAGMSENPTDPEPFVEMGKLDLVNGHNLNAIKWLEIAVENKPGNTTVVQNPLANTYRPYVLLAEANLNIGGSGIEKALEWAEKALKIIDDEPTRALVEKIKKVKKHKMAAEAAKGLTSYLRLEGESEKIVPLLNSLPHDLQDNPVVLSVRKQYTPPKRWPNKSVAIFTGNAVIGEWGPWSLEEGIGGSEEAIIRVAHQLRDQGYEVHIFANPGIDAGEYSEIHWHNYWEIDLRDTFDIFIAWRSPWFFDASIKAKKRYLWMHDVMEEAEFTPERLKNLDGVMLLSEFHRSLFPEVPDDKVFITANGIDATDFQKYDGKVDRDPKRIIYTSSHTRGLSRLYEVWPEIKKAVPDAKLDVYYGWQSYDAVNKNNPERMAWKHKMQKWVKDLKDVTDHGKVSQDKIVKETMASGIWAYPTAFPEISCITAMKCQAGGAIPVTSDFAALAETVRFGSKMNLDDWDEGGKERYTQELIRYLKDEKLQLEQRSAMIKEARKYFSWKKVVQGWNKEFQNKNVRSRNSGKTAPAARTKKSSSTGSRTKRTATTPARKSG